MDFVWQWRRRERMEKRLTRAFEAVFDTLFYYHTPALIHFLPPMRMNSRRAYDTPTETFSPDGEHIPFVLPSLLNNLERRRLLESFGAESGLFKKIEVKRLGEYNTDPAYS